MTLQRFLQSLGTPVQDAEEETFELFAQDLPSQNLGFIDSRATTLELTVAGRDLVITQSPGILSSNRAGGTTGAVVWKITPLFAAWLASPHSNNPLWTHHILTPSSRVLELGCGISGLVALLLGPRVARYVLTDQPYVARLVEQNVEENWRVAASSHVSSSHSVHSAHSSPSPSSAPSAARATRRNASSKAPRASPRHGSPAAGAKGNNNNNSSFRARGVREAREARGVVFTPLDWETDAVTSALAGPAETEAGKAEPARGFDVVVACDCIYNEALVEPFVATCVDLCRLRRGGNAGAEERGGELSGEATVCVVAQQLRDPDVFEAWAVRFARSFHTWRVPDELLVEGLRANTGFVVHVGVLKDDINLEAI